MAYFLSGQDSFSDFRGRVKPSCCPNPACQTVLDPFAHPFPGKAKPKDDLTCIANEGLALASPRLMDFILERSTTKVSDIQTGGGYHVLRPACELLLDLSRCGLYVGEPCDTCGRNASLIVSTGRPMIARGENVDPFGLYRSVQEFGNFSQRRFDLIAGDAIAEEMRRNAFRGVILSEIYKPIRRSGFSPTPPPAKP
ncbi:MAG: hypothetical protein E6Q73_00935 [Pseudorhodobacter sp.]|nr:MAG: hypothetical protein E6Q73_00935 [Pseudorhodobacter sp.]